jgi:hypothetical protein
MAGHIQQNRGMKARALVLGLFVTCLAPAALAQDRFATAGRFAVGVERAFGYASTTTKIETDLQPGNVNYESDTTRTQFDFLARGTVKSPFVAPRVGFDYFVIDGLSIGGALGYYSTEHDGDETRGNNKTDIVKEEDSGWLVAPRVGYCFMFTDMVGIWPRGGFTYASGKEERSPPVGADQKLEADVLDLTIEGMLVISPVPHAGFMVGPTLEFPLSGSGELDQGNASQDLDDIKVTTLALQAGVFAWF